MKAKISFPLFALFGLTRGMAGIGAGLLLADRVAHNRRKKIGFALFAAGAASTLPLVFAFMRQRRRGEVAGVMDPMTKIYTPEMGTVDDAEFESPQQSEPPTMRH
ncbi:MAG TPA: hypothetical protein VIV40_14305 [Kofleriaceae bacterium]